MASNPRRKLSLVAKEQALHMVTVPRPPLPQDSWQIPSSSFSSFLGLPLGFLPGVVAFRVLAPPLFLLLFGRQGASLWCWHFTGLLRRLLAWPAPAGFSVRSFSYLEARGWLGFEPDSLIFFLYGEVKSDWAFLSLYRSWHCHSLCELIRYP